MFPLEFNMFPGSNYIFGIPVQFYVEFIFGVLVNGAWGICYALPKLAKSAHQSTIYLWATGKCHFLIYPLSFSTTARLRFSLHIAGSTLMRGRFLIKNFTWSVF